jgi:hypothetical protein
MSDSSRFALGTGRARPQHQARSLNCPQCGAGLTVQDEHSELIVCASCNTHVDLTGVEAAALTQPARASEWNFSLSIGDKWLAEGFTYTVAARLAFVEDDSNPTLNYLLFNPSRGSFWASEYKGQWAAFAPTRLMPQQSPFSLAEGGRLQTGDNRKWTKTSGGFLELAWVDGALPWQAQLGDRVEYAEFKGPNGALYEAQRTNNEIEYGEGRSLSLGDVDVALGRASAGGGGNQGGAGKPKRKRRGCGVFGVIALIVGAIAVVAAIELLGPLDAMTRTFAENALAERNELVDSTTKTRGAFDKLKASSPELLGEDAAQWAQVLGNTERKLNSLGTQAEELQGLLDADRGYDTSAVYRLTDRLNDERINNKSMRNVQAHLERITKIRADPAPLIKAMPALHASIHKETRRRLDLIAQASARWPDKASAFSKQVATTQQFASDAEKLWNSALPAHTRAGQAALSDADLRVLLDAYDALYLLETEVKTDDAGKRAEQLFWARETVLVDMDAKVAGQNLSLRQQLRSIALRVAAEPGAQKVTDTRAWRDVGRAFVNHEEHLGMTIMVKPAGRFDSERVRVVGPPGYGFMCDRQCRENEFGAWQASANEEVWQFGPDYRWISEQLWPAGHQVTREDYDKWVKSASSRVAHWGGSRSSSRVFGSSATGILALYAASIYARNGGFNVPAMQRSAQLARQRAARQARIAAESYRNSSSSGSRSSGGK